MGPWDSWRDEVDDGLRDVTDGRVGLSDDMTTTDDALGGSAREVGYREYAEQRDRARRVKRDAVTKTDDAVDETVEKTRGTLGGASETLEETVEKATSPRKTADKALRDLTGGKYGLSDDLTSMEDAGGLRGGLEAVDDGTAGATDFLLDNRRASVQDGSRSVLRRLTGADSDAELAEQFKSADDGLTETIDRSIEGTALDNDATDLVRKGGDALFVDGARVAIGAGTGIDTRTGGTEARTGLAEAADLGLTIGTGGAGKLGLRALKGSDDVGRAARSLFDRGGSTAARGSDDATEAAGDAATASDDVTESADPLSLTGPDGEPVDGPLAQLANRFRRSTSDDLPVRGSDDVTDASRGADEAADAEPDNLPVLFRESDDAARGSDGAARGSDDAARETDDAARGADDGANTTRRSTEPENGTGTGSPTPSGGDDAAESLADRIGGLMDDVRARLPTRPRPSRPRAPRPSRPSAPSIPRPGRLTTGLFAGAGGVVAGGAIVASQLPDTIETKNGGTLVRATEYPELEDVEDRPGGVLYSVQEGGVSQGYTLVTGIRGNKVYMLDRSGNESTAPIEPDAFKQQVQAGAAPGYLEDTGGNA